MWESDYKESWVPKNLCSSNCGTEEDFWESFELQGDPTSPSQRRSVLGVHWKDWCWSWNSNTLATWCKELTQWTGPWCWERLKVRGKGNNRGWDGWMALPTRWISVWACSGSCWGQGSLAFCSPWGRKELDMTEWLNCIEKKTLNVIKFPENIISYSYPRNTK